jgi:hypothetical protein
MEHPEQSPKNQKEDFKHEFEKRKKRRIAVSVFIMVLLIGALFTYPRFELFGIPKHIWGSILSFVIIGLILFIALDWRCPVCKGLMGDVFQTKFCPKCGYKFRD